MEDFDLRRLAMEHKNTKMSKEIRANIHDRLLEAMREAGMIIFNLDDSNCLYDDLYDPELSTLLGGRVVHNSIWTPEVMIDKKVWSCFDKKVPAPSVPYTVLKLYKK